MGIIKIDKLENGTIDVRVKYSGKLIGCFNMLEDGFYYFWPLPPTGYFSTEVLLELGRELEKINQAWDEHIKEHLGKTTDTIDMNDEEFIW